MHERKEIRRSNAWMNGEFILRKLRVREATNGYGLDPYIEGIKAGISRDIERINRWRDNHGKNKKIGE